ncbi:iron ABC transporter substrate-binding protein [Corynebacterium sp. HMSC11D10]|uniref:ABC transporter substrate-binding protein n=1 Tax=Corynebacterium sp. HMSC11D10 TaxID=1581088 RepID=UPI0008A4776B|nr:ABC transporter substrate-binding protein [Corynebacterium sp. HMSC11D10]OFU54412.1 iron ABC transporter substrate-binding protein [Corynebacterium sp. HMSC11D10]
MPESLTRRFLPALAALLSGALLLGGCASDEQPESATQEPVNSTSTEFPVTLHNAYGDITIPTKPERVAALGYADVALASAMGANVVVAPESFTKIAGAGDERNLPYIDPLPAETTWLNPMSINVEQVAAAKPDVILATAAFTLDEAMYLQLSDIAPVVTYEEALYSAPSEESAQRIGQALGESDAAELLIQRADEAVAEIRAELPHLAGGTFLYGQARDGVVVMLVDEDNVTARFMHQLGLASLPAVAELGGQGSVPGSIDVSFEQAPLFNDAGVLFMTFQSDALQDKFETDPIVSKQPIMSERYMPVGLEAATALQDPNVASIPWLLNELRPGLELIPAS